MTSDAKIGLLLGLVFIFIIAFVVNGLPKLRSADDSNELTIISADSVVNPDKANPGLGAKERRAGETFSVSPSVEKNPGSDLSAKQLSQTRPPADDGSIRYASPLPQLPLGTNDTPLGGLGGPANQFVRPAGKQTSIMDTLTGNKPGPAESVHDYLVKQDGVRPVTEGQSGGDTPAKEPKPVVQPAADAGKTLAAKSTVSAQSGGAKTYTVAGGDSLASIAKKLYGPEEGNKRANIDRIFQANRNILKSPDLLYEGQKLTIPALSPAVSGTTSAKSIFPSTLVEKVESIGRKVITTNKPADEKMRYYVVKDDDSLWDIAVAQLGKGGRWSEIVKLNTDIIKNPDHVPAGMRLKLPVK
jgi:nucleoid-associated protein YgaU